jgi:hypothetical protein
MERSWGLPPGRWAAGAAGVSPFVGFASPWVVLASFQAFSAPTHQLGIRMGCWKPGHHQPRAGAVFRKKSGLALSLGAVAAGVRNRTDSVAAVTMPGSKGDYRFAGVRWGATASKQSSAQKWAGAVSPAFTEDTEPVKFDPLALPPAGRS